MRIAILTAVCCLLATADVAWAQFGGAGGTQSSFGNRSLGSSLSAGSRTIGRGTSGQGVSGATTQDTGQAGQVTGNERFLRQNRQGQFVGSDATDAGNIFSALTGNTGLGRGNAGGLRGNAGGQNPNSGNQQSTARYFPTRRVIGFDYTVPRAAISRQLGQRYGDLPGIANLGEIDVTIEGRVATLRGTVATAHDREVAARVALLEAGISGVQNELTVAEPKPADASEPVEPRGPRAF